MRKNILGISAFYHDSAAAIIVDNNIIAAAQEERFTRIKHDKNFPTNSIKYCLKEANLNLEDIDNIVFYEKPFIKFERLLETYIYYSPKGLESYLTAIPVWLKEKMFQKKLIKDELIKLSNLSKKSLPKVLFTEHHMAHAASAFYPSPFNKAAILCIDGVGEWTTTSVWLGENNKITPCWQIDFPHSLGLLYSAFTYYIGFKVNSGEYKLMGLAPYGKPKYVDTILENLLDLKEDGTFKINMKYFNYCTGLTMTNKKFNQLFGEPPRNPESPLTQKHMDIAHSIQQVTEKIILMLVKTIKKETKAEYLCLAGGVALNCVANGKILEQSGFKDIWIQPAAGDAGGALGAALVVQYQYYNTERKVDGINDLMKGSYLGPKYSKENIKKYLNSIDANYKEYNDNELYSKLSDLLDDGNIIGWFHGRMEFGPRALGGRSIIGDPRNAKMQSIMNLKIKYRESFRPFAPSVISEKVNDYFELKKPSPYMLLVAPVKKELQIETTSQQKKLFGIEKLNIQRSTIPAITHVDYSARVQTVHKETNQKYYDLIKKFEEKTGCGVIVNTSFNIRGEPIVNTPADAFNCFMGTEMDYLVLENFVLCKSKQNKDLIDKLYIEKFELD
ncbi:MAG: carbamoyltransferase [Clostridiales bacterium]